MTKKTIPQDQNPKAIHNPANDSKVNDMRDIARQEHTNHFTNRAPSGKKS